MTTCQLKHAKNKLTFLLKAVRLIGGDSSIAFLYFSTTNLDFRGLYSLIKKPSIVIMKRTLITELVKC